MEVGVNFCSENCRTSVNYAWQMNITSHYFCLTSEVWFLHASLYNNKRTKVIVLHRFLKNKTEENLFTCLQFIAIDVTISDTMWYKRYCFELGPKLLFRAARIQNVEPVLWFRENDLQLPNFIHRLVGFWLSHASRLVEEFLKFYFHKSFYKVDIIMLWVSKQV